MEQQEPTFPGRTEDTEQQQSRADGNAIAQGTSTEHGGSPTKKRIYFGADSGSGRRSPYQSSSPSRCRTDFTPVMAKLTMSPRISRAKCARSFRPEVVTTSRRMTNRPCRCSLQLKATSSVLNSPSSKSPAAWNAAGAEEEAPARQPQRPHQRVRPACKMRP